MQLMHLPFNAYLIAFVFFSTLCSYNFHYILGSAYSEQRITLKLLYNRYTAVLVALCGTTGVLFFIGDANIPLPDVLIAFVLTFMYSIPLLPFKQLAFTRKAGILKTLLLAFTWMFVTAYIPLSAAHLEFTDAGLLVMAKRFLFMLMLCIFFDNRDIAVDKIHGLSSLATHLSPATMKWLIYSVFAALFIINFLLGKEGIDQRQVIALQLSAVINLVVYFFSLKKQGYFFYYFVVDGMMVLMTLLTALATI